MASQNMSFFESHVSFSLYLLFFTFFCFSMTQMHWERRYKKDNGSQCLVSVDGTDFEIQEPSPFSPKWFSHKFKGAGVRYEVAICIQTGEPVWINGPFPCGSWNDLRIARSALVDALDPGEYYLADGGYRDGNQWSVTPSGRHRFDDKQKSVVRARHETYNKRLKDWGALREVYRHKLDTHSQVFRAIANIVQIAISNGATLFEVEYNV
jgi:DDE superfamily endonuclease